ncbi:MAG: hypothetical protein Q9213_003199 [Squamulea squamosa]
MSQANQLSIATLFGGSTNQSALSGPPDQQTLPECAASTMLANQPVAPSGRITDKSSKKSEEVSAAASHGQEKPLFQNFERYHPTEIEIKTAEEVQYEELAQMFHEEGPPETPTSPTFSPSLPDNSNKIQPLKHRSLLYSLNPLSWLNSRSDRPVHSDVPTKISTILAPEHLGYEPFEEFIEDEVREIENDAGRSEHEDDGEALAPFNKLERKGTE